MQSIYQYFGDIRVLYPELILIVTILLVIVLDLVFKGKRRGFLMVVSVSGLIVSLLTINYNVRTSTTLFFNSLVFDPLAILFKMLFSFGGILSILVFLSSTEIPESDTGEFLVMLLGSIAGMFVLVSANDVILFYLAFETISLPSYVLSGISSDPGRGKEAALKYMLYGAVASGMMLFGFSLLCGITGATNFQSINSMLSMSPVTPGTMAVIVSLIIAGLAFKVSAVPFHMWTPDVYEGSAIPVTAYFSVVPKAAGFAALFRFFLSIFYQAPTSWNFVNSKEWFLMWTTISAVTMTLGNLAAIQQNNIKRLLAYSSISHVGYMLIGIIGVTVESMVSILFYLVVYLFMNLGAFYVALLFRERLGTEDVNEYAGVGWRSPFFSATLSVFLLSLVGIPPLAGFTGKVIIFASAIHEKFYFIVLLAVLNSVVSLYYYARIIKKLFLEFSENNAPIYEGVYPKILLLIFLAPIIILGIYWNRFYLWIGDFLGLQ